MPSGNQTWRAGKRTTKISDCPSYKPPLISGIFQPAMFDDTRYPGIYRGFIWDLVGVYRGYNGGIMGITLVNLPFGDINPGEKELYLRKILQKNPP